MGISIPSFDITDNDKNTIKSENTTSKRINKLQSTTSTIIEDNINSIMSNMETITNGVTISEDNNTLALNKDGNVNIIDLSTRVDNGEPSMLHYGILNRNSNFIDGTKSHTYTIARYGAACNVVKDVTLNSYGSLFVAQYVYYIGDDYLPINANGKYRASYTAKSETRDGSSGDGLYSRHYIGVVCYDNKKRHIAPWQVSGRYLTDSTIVNDVAIGSTEIIVSGDYSRWYQGSTSHKRTILAHKLAADGTYAYTDEDGTIYDELGYSRDAVYHAFAKNGLTDLGNGTFKIKLRNGLPFSLNAGDKIRNSYSGSTFNYWLSYSPIEVGKGFQTKISGWRDHHLGIDPKRYWEVFRNGTRYVKLLGLLNYRVTNTNGPTTSSSNINTWFSEIKLEHMTR